MRSYGAWLHQGLSSVGELSFRRSKLNVNGTEESTNRQEYEIANYIRDNNMGVIVQTYKDITSAWKPGATRPSYRNALVDLASGAIDGIAVLSLIPPTS
jgi:hypothetical protein